MHTFCIRSQVGDTVVEATLHSESAAVLAYEALVLCEKVPAFQAMLTLLQVQNEPTLLEAHK